MATKRSLFDLDLCLIKQIRPYNSVIEDIGDMNSIVAIHAAGHWPAAAIYDTGKFRILCAFGAVTKRLKLTVNSQTKQHFLSDSYSLNHSQAAELAMSFCDFFIS